MISIKRYTFHADLTVSEISERIMALPCINLSTTSRMDTFCGKIAKDKIRLVCTPSNAWFGKGAFFCGKMKPTPEGTDIVGSFIPSLKMVLVLYFLVCGMVMVCIGGITGFLFGITGCLFIHLSIMLSFATNRKARKELIAFIENDFQICERTDEKRPEGVRMDQKQTLKIAAAGLLGGAVWLVFLIHLVFGFDVFKAQDLAFIEKVNNEAVAANVLLITVTKQENSTVYSPGHSGVIFRKDGNSYYVLTALHAIDPDCLNIIVLGHDQPTYDKSGESGGLSNYYAQFPEAVVMHYDAAYDLCVLYFQSDDAYTALPLAAQAPQYNEPVAAMGNPYGRGRNVVTTGEITSKTPVPFGDEAGETQHPVITHSAKIYAGSSGSVLLNKNLEIVGINLGASENSFRFIAGKAVPCDKIAEFLDGI